MGKTKRGKGMKWMVVVGGQGISLGAHLGSASPTEVAFLETTIDEIAVPRSGRGVVTGNARDQATPYCP